jgi:hypothetical protein
MLLTLLALNSRKQLVSELNLFLIKTDPKPQEMIELMGKFNVSESFYQRLTNILPKDFQLKKIFFFDCLIKRSRYLSDKKELHITNQQEPHANEMNEHYCRRWISIKTIEQSIEQNNSHFFDAQISRYENSGNEFFVSHPQLKILSKDCMRSISVGILITPSVKKNQIHR